MARALMVLFIWAAGLLSPAMAQQYSVEVGDRLEIFVLEEPGLNRTVLVRPDGRISLPLAGTIEAAGNTPEAIQAQIRRSLSSQFVEPPTVTVSVVSLGNPQGAAEAAGGSVYVMGQVGRPGVYPLTGPMDALAMLAQAGGPGPFAARQRIQIRRRDSNGGETVFLLDYETIEDGLVPSERIELADGDVIIVPERRLFE